MGLLDQKLVSEMKIVPKQRKNKNWKVRFKKKQKRKNHKKQKHVFVRPKYAIYILSKSWRARCYSFMKRYGKVCVACGEKKNLHVHHMTYRNLGREKDEELAVLCKYCHAELHERIGTKLDMVEETVSFILEKKGL